MSNELMEMGTEFNLAESMADNKTVSFCSMTAEKPEEKVALFNAMNNPEKRLKDMVNMTIDVKDIYVEIIDVVNTQTGEMQKAPRIVLIDKDNVGYQCVSIGIYSALKKLFQIYGMPTWQDGIKLKVVLINKGKDRSILSVTPTL